MTYLVTQLVTSAYHLAGIVGEDFEELTASQLTRGVDLFNDLLSLQSVRTRLIPYHSSYTNTFTVNHETTFIPNLVSVDVVTYLLTNTLRLPLEYQDRDSYYGSSRVQPLDSLPFMYHDERTLGGSNLNVYFFPDQPYQYTIWGKFGFSSVTNTTDLSTLYDRFYLFYLKYELSSFVCQENNIQLQPDVVKELNSLRKNMTDISPLDMTIKKVSTLQDGYTPSWAFINLSRGWTR